MADQAHLMLVPVQWCSEVSVNEVALFFDGILAFSSPCTEVVLAVTCLA